MNVVHAPLHFHKSTGIFIAAAIVLSPLAAINDAHACAACGCTLSRDWGTQGIRTTPGFSADLSYDYINQNQQRYGSGAASTAQINSLLPGDQEVEDYTVTRTTTASLNYAGDTWGASVQLPFIQRTHAAFGNAPPGDYSTYSASSDSGIGDVRVTGIYSGLSSGKSTGIIAGIKLPTGSTDTNFNAGDEAGNALDRSLQISTGSTDLIVGGFVTGNLGEYGWFAQGTVQHAVATKTIGGADYVPGDTFSLNTGIRHARFGARFTPMLQLNYIHRAPDDVGGTPLDGGTLIYLAPGASVRAGGGTSVYGFIQLPIYQNVIGLQLTPRYTLTIGVAQTFE